MVILHECQAKKNNTMLQDKRDAHPPGGMTEITSKDCFYTVNR
jgi:hypothetical protein